MSDHDKSGSFKSVVWPATPVVADGWRMAVDDGKGNMIILIREGGKWIDAAGNVYTIEVGA